MAQRRTTKGRGRDVFFEESEPQQLKHLSVKTPKRQNVFERSTIYFRKEEQDQLETLTHNLRRELRNRGESPSLVDKSALTRAAVRLLLNQDIQETLRLLSEEEKEAPPPIREETG